MFKKFFMLTILACMITVLSGCQEEKYELNAWKTLALTAVTYDQTMTTLGELHTKGTVSDEVANKAVDFGKKFTPLYLAAVKSLEVFVKNPDETKVDTVKNAINKCMSNNKKRSINMILLFLSLFIFSYFTYPASIVGFESKLLFFSSALIDIQNVVITISSIVANV